MPQDPMRQTLPRKPLVAGNWKMNGLRAALGEMDAMARGFDADLRKKVDLLVCPPATLLAAAAAAMTGTAIAVGAQTCHAAASGAHTGELSAEMLADAGARFIIAGHSERRQNHAETDATVRGQAQAVLRAGLVPIICVGETRAEREGGRAEAVVGAQVAGSVPETVEEIVIAYEPVWAIGTGLTPTPADVAAMHGVIRAALAGRVGAEGAARTRLLYGGSVKPENATSLLFAGDVDGALVGGASLKAADFLKIAEAYRAG